MKMLMIGFLIATFSKVFADELKEWMAWLPARVIRWSARHLPKGTAERFEEEWLAHCNDLPGNCSKLWHATGCVIVYLRCTRAAEKALWWTTMYPFMELACFQYLVLALLFATFGIPLYRGLRPEITRLRRLRRKAGGLTVLGINDLELIPDDYRLLELLDAANESRVLVFMSGIMIPEFSQALFKRRFRLISRVTNWFFQH